MLVLLFGLSLAAQLPAVQTMLAHKAMSIINGKINGRVEVGSVHISPFEGVSISDVAIIDDNAYIPSEGFQEDTIFRAKHINAIFSPKGLLSPNGISIAEARVSDGFFVFVSEPLGDGIGKTTNIGRVFSTGEQKQEKEKKESNLSLSISKIETIGIEFRMKLYAPDGSLDPCIPADAINWKDLDIFDINLGAKKIRIRDGIISSTVNSLTFKEKSGLDMTRLAGKVRVGGGKTDIRDLVIQDSSSDIRMEKFMLSYSGISAFSSFMDEVRIDADIQRSTVDFKTISYFAKALKKMSFSAQIDGRFNGYVSDFSLSSLNFQNTHDGMHGTIDGRLRGLPDVQNMTLDAKLTDADFTTAELGDFIRGFAPGVKLDLGRFAHGHRFHFNATARGTLNKLSVVGQANSSIGGFTSAISLKNTIDSSKPIQIGGNISTRSLDLGAVTGSGKLGPGSITAALEARLLPGDPQVRLDTLAVKELQAHGYSYKNIYGRGRYSSEGFNIDLVSNDPNLTFVCNAVHKAAAEGKDGMYSLYLDLSKADFKQLGLGFKDEANAGLSLGAEAYINERTDGRADGEIQLRNIILNDDHGLHKAGDLLAAVDFRKGDNSLALNSSFLEGSFKGSGTPLDLAKDFSQISLKRELPAIFGESTGAYSGNSYDIDLNLFDSMDVLSFLVPGLYAADSTDIKMGISKEGLLDAKISSGRLAYKNKYLKGVNIGIDNKDSLLSAHINADELSLSPIITKGNILKLAADSDRASLELSYDNESELTNRGDIHLQSVFSRDEDNALAINASVIPTTIYVDSVPWSLNPADLAFSGGRISVHDFGLSSGKHSINIEGGYSSTAKDTLKLTLDNFDLSAANTHLGGKFSLGGLASGEATLMSPLKEMDGIFVNLKVDSTTLSGYKAGTLLVGSSWNQDKKGFEISLRNVLEGRSNIAVDGLFDPSSKSIDGDVMLDSLELGYAEGFLDGIFSEFRGKLSGKVNVSGPLDKMDLNSDGLKIEDGLMHVEFTDVPYKVSGPLHIDSSGAWLDNVAISDSYGEGGTVSGGIGWNRFKDITMGVAINFTKMLVLDMKEDAGAAFYGRAFGSGKLGINGSLTSMTLDVTAATEKQGEFHIPMSSASSSGTSDLLVFKKDERGQKADSYEIMMSRYSAPKRGTDLGINLNLTVGQGTQAFVEIDKASGNVLSGRGNGNLAIEVHPNDGVFDLKGTYTLTEGNYHLDVMGIAKKDFKIEEGSSIKFGGDIMDSDLNITATYSTKASLGALIGDNSTTTRRTVECEIDISDKLKSPKIGLAINVPDLNPSTKAMVDNALDSEDKLQKQFLSLLVSGSFLPDDKSGIVNNSNTLNTTVAEIMASQLNNILQRLDIPIDLGLDFQSTSSGKSVYDVAISTALFNNRVIVNGTIGNSEYSTSTTGGDDFVGDLDVEVKVDKTGSLRLNFFSHSADQYSNFLDNSQRNGLGVAYQREFNSFKEFLRDVFSTRKRREEREAARIEAMTGGEKKVIKVEK